MKIKAIRLAEFGRFSAPVAIEGLSGRLDVLAGPNELGKSTLLAALRLALFEKYGTARKDVKELRPYGGGAPTVEVEFEAGQKRWRVRKRFLTQPFAELTDLGNGRLLRGEDAETQLRTLVGASGGMGRFGLVWVGQQGSLTLPVPAGIDDGLPSLHRALQNEVEAVASGGHVKKLRAEVRRQLAEMLSNHATRRPTGVYAAALKSVTTKQAACAEAAAALQHIQSRLDQLGTLRQREAALADPIAVASRAARITTSRATFEAARGASARRDLVAEALKAAEAELAAAQSAAATLAAALAEIATRAAAEARISDEQTTLGTETLRLEAAAREHRQRIDALRQRRESLAAEQALSHAGERRRAAKVRADELTQRIATVDALGRQQAVLTEQRGRIAATPDVLKAAERAAAAIHDAETRLTAAAPAVSVTYAPGGEGRLRIGGRALQDGETFTPSERLIIEIEGIGQIRVAPGGGTSVLDMRAARDKHQTTLALVLAQAGVVDLAGLETASEQRRQIEREFSDIEARLAALAPDGIDELRASLQSTFTAASEGDAAPSRTLADIDAEIVALRGELAEAERAIAPVEQALATARERGARLAAEFDASCRRRTVLEAHVPPAGPARTAETERRNASAASAETKVRQMVRDLAAWAELAPDAAELGKLQEATLTAETEARAAETELARIQQDAAHIEGELGQARNDDIEMRATVAADELERAEAEARRLDQEVAVLHVLDRELGVQEDATRSEFLAPVLARLAPYLNTLFPGAEIAFDAALAPQGLARNQIREALERTSQGTQEQIAVLVRLAFARLFADTGHTVPLILDDALVYSDDQRISSMFRALEQAAEHHQVIVLTCRTLAFERLRGERVRLAPWLRAEAA